ncbi:NIPSNAP family protein [Amylibacter sp. IMCC11727]|uniref:NIPSNAP family protein n=1 Tax=Amylibacter sp. IMCC11727 TaxID=3039851 RepID=UPI00244E1AC4|nr:NIPSNAP family protein [Amylibacter sp. IMCC11727]WGI20714.1 NIPSNAP family protein [Amylibacter sp. IMCC11727]
MILEIRHYTLHPNKREDFIKFFETENRKALRDAGMLVFGPMRDLENPDKVHWMRAFPSLEQREQIKDTFYNGPVWNEQIEHKAMPMIAHFTADVVETTERFENFNGDPAL